MSSRRSQLPPLYHLIAFEAAATAGGFTAAVEQLNLSQAAISRKSVQLCSRGERLLDEPHRSMD